MADRRQSSARTSPERRISSVSRDTNPDIFSDDFSLEPLAVADGYQPSSSTPDPNRSLPRINVPRSNGHLSNHESKPSTASTRKPRLSSSNAGLAARNSFSLRHDAQYSDAPHRVPSIAYSHTSETSNRPLSIASTFMQPRTQSPFVGNSAPSHPYAMYPQNTSVNRNSTVSTIRPQERSYIGPSHPTHPYGMYAQTTAPEGESNALLGSTDITSVGFPGIPQQYARRLGPNGEEADDIIGPDGHTEQLPPYTRYADALPAKERSAFEPTTPETPISPQSLAGQEPASASVISRDSRAPLNPGGNDLQPGERGSDEAGSREKWMTRGKKRTCFGKLPVWAVALLVIALIAVAAVVGGLVGRYLKGSSKNMVPPPPRSPDG